MGEGFVVMQSNDVDIYYYQDEPGMYTHTHTHTVMGLINDFESTYMLMLLFFPSPLLHSGR